MIAPAGPRSATVAGSGCKNIWMGEAHSGCGWFSSASPHRSGLPASRTRLSSLREEPPPEPTEATLTLPPRCPLPPDLSLKAPTDSALSTWVAPTHSAARGTVCASKSASWNWPETVVCTASRPLRWSSPSSDTAPSGSFV